MRLIDSSLTTHMCLMITLVDIRLTILIRNVFFYVLYLENLIIIVTGTYMNSISYRTEDLLLIY